MLEQKIADLTVAVTELQRTIEALIKSNDNKQSEVVTTVTETATTGLEANTVIIDEPKTETAPTEQPKADVKTDEKAEEPKTETKSYTVEELRKMCIDAATAGKTQDVCDFLASKGVKKLTQLDPQYYNELADLLTK